MDDLVKRLREPADWAIERPLVELRNEAADRIEQLHEALELADCALRGANMNMDIVERKIRAALGDKHD